MKVCVVIPTLDARDLLLDCLASLASQDVAAEVIVVDNGSQDGTSQAVAEHFPSTRIVRLEQNLGFGRAVNRGVEAAGHVDAIVLVNNDTVCCAGFLAALLAPLADPAVGMVAGVLLQVEAPERIDSAGIEIDLTLGSHDMLWNEDLERLATATEPVGPCGGAAAYRFEAFRAAGGFDDALFAYWEDVDLALRLRLAGWSCVRAPAAQALHRHGATLGAASPTQRRLHSFGRGYTLGRYRVPQGGVLMRARIALLDWPVLVVHLLARREAGPIRARARGLRAGYAHAPLRPPLELATVSLCGALRRQATLLTLRLTGSLPGHFREHGPGTTTDMREARPTDRA